MSVANPILAPDRTQSMIAVARVVMGLCFIYYGVSKLFFIPGTIGFVASKLPLPAEVFWLSVVIETGGGLLLVIGLKTRWVAAWFAFYCCFTAAIFHTDFANRFTMDHFFENFALAGGFLSIMAVGPGAAAVDNRVPSRSS
jgi:putative oxidoreductase